jgi:hypothetical protein
MKTIVENAKGFVSSLRQQHPDVSIFKTDFVAIGEDGIIRLSPYTNYLVNARIGIVVCYYNYLVQTATDDSCFILFVDDSGYCDDHYYMNGWTIGFKEPYTSGYRTYGRRECILSNGIINLELSLPVNGFAEQIRLLWPYYLKAQECQTQKELLLLKDCFKKDIDISILKKENFHEEHMRIITEETLNAYKAVLDKIERMLIHN